MRKYALSRNRFRGSNWSRKEPAVGRKQEDGVIRQTKEIAAGCAMSGLLEMLTGRGRCTFCGC
jgi:hypothetical protein